LENALIIVDDGGGVIEAVHSIPREVSSFLNGLTMHILGIIVLLSE
jgi:hypothetical protein